MPTRWILELGKARTFQSPLRVGSVFHGEYLGLQRFSEEIDNEMGRSCLRPHESAKRWLEIAVDLVRVVQSSPACEMCRGYCYYLNTGEVTTEPHESPKYPHEPFKVQLWSTLAQILSAKMRSGPRGIVCFADGKLMIP